MAGKLVSFQLIALLLLALAGFSNAHEDVTHPAYYKVRALAGAMPEIWLRLDQAAF